MSDVSIDTKNLLRLEGSFSLIGLGVLILIAVAGVWITIAATGPAGSLGLSLLWALAFMVVGMFLGFIFCVPRTLKAERKENEGDSSNQPRGLLDINTNLTEISDWLTKIIVGVGLVEMKEIPAAVNHLAGTIAGTLKMPNASIDATGVADAVIVVFTLLGFLLGYLATRLYLTPLFATADAISTQSRRAALSRFASGEEAFKVLKDVALPFNEQGKSVDELLTHYATVYMGANSPDLKKRVADKNDAASKMAAIALRHNISRDSLESKTRTPPNEEGYIAGLATLINAAPEAGDLDRLEKIARQAKWKHAKYKIALALGAVFSNKIYGKDNLGRASAALKELCKGETDDHLLRQILRTVALIDQSTEDRVRVPRKARNFHG